MIVSVRSGPKSALSSAVSRSSQVFSSIVAFWNMPRNAPPRDQDAAMQPGYPALSDAVVQESGCCCAGSEAEMPGIPGRALSAHPGVPAQQRVACTTAELLHNRGSCTTASGRMDG